jgi:serine/threonine-protein kinase
MAATSQLGRYELLARLVTGRIGEWFLARPEGAVGSDPLLLIKRILPRQAEDARFRATLREEARTVSHLSHPNLCPIDAIEPINHQIYLVMQYLEGATLLQLMLLAAARHHKLAYGFIAGVIHQVCEGLHYAHELCDGDGVPLGAVHREVTPSTLFLTRTGTVKLLDFGVARLRDAANAGPREIKGKYAYLAPELRHSQAIDRRADVFSLGAVVFEMLTGQRLFQCRTDYLTFRALKEPPLLDLAHHRPDVSPAVAGVLSRALAREPAARYPTVRAFGDALLEAFAVPRPWTEGDIAELVQTEFARELGARRSEIAQLIERRAEASAGALPVISFARPAVEPSESHSIVERSGIPPIALSRGLAFGAE